MSVLTLAIGDCAVTVDAEEWETTKSVVVGQQKLLVTAKPSSLRWSILKQRHSFYVVAYQSRPKSLLLHRLLLQVTPNLFCDHINGNGLDNRMSNLRCCTLAQNNANRRPKKHSSQFVGVQKTPHGWLARGFLNGKVYHLGTFATEIEAAAARDQFVRKHKPEFGLLNLQPTGGAK